MKHLYDGTAKDPDFQIGLQVWLYTPRRRKGLSPKLMHNWHGPFRFISKLSEGHLCLRTLDNNLVTTAVHANHMKLYHDPNDRPILLPDVDNVDDQYLKNSDLPPESFTAVNDMDEKADPSSSTSRASELNHEKHYQDGPAPPHQQTSPYSKSKTMNQTTDSMHTSLSQVIKQKCAKH